MVRHSNNRWALLIGVNGYHESLGELKYSINDCRRLAGVLTTGDDAFPTENVLVLADDEGDERRPTYAGIHSWLASWLAQPDEDDTVLVDFAGHGREIDGKCYLVPGDATLQTIHVTGIPVPYVQELLERCKARQKVLILDACHSGAGRDVSSMAAPMMEALSAGKGITTLTSCGEDELSHEWHEKNQGVFSYYLGEALSGSCPPDAHGRITADAVYDWVYQRVQRWASEHRCSQNPRRMASTSGTITLRQSDPDWRQIARDLQSRLDREETEQSTLRQELAALRARSDPEMELRACALRFLDERNGSKKAWRQFINKVRTTLSDLTHTDAELRAVLDEAARTSPHATQADAHLKVVVLPENVAARYRLDDERVEKTAFSKPMAPGRHSITVIPDSRRFGVRRVEVFLGRGTSTRKVIHLRKVLHARSVFSCLIYLAFCAILGLCYVSLAGLIDELKFWFFTLGWFCSTLVTGFLLIPILGNTLSAKPSDDLYGWLFIYLMIGTFALGGLSLVLWNATAPGDQPWVVAAFHAVIGCCWLLAPWPEDYYRQRPGGETAGRKHKP